MIMCHKRAFLLLEIGAKGRSVKLTPALLMEHVRRAILKDGVRSVTPLGSFGDTWIVDVTTGHLSDRAIRQLAMIATDVDTQDKGGFTRLFIRFL
jgi:hypothetical protein